MKTMKRIPKQAAQTPLERHVRNWVNAQTKNYTEGVAGVFKDLNHGGCSSGYVGHLISYKDTVRFYKRHQKEIDAMLVECAADAGTTPAGLFGGKWDDSDPLARDYPNQNLLAWFGFEEAARNIEIRVDQLA